MKKILDFSNLPTSSNKSLKELLIYDGVSYWWLIDSVFHLDVIGTYKLRKFASYYSFCVKYFRPIILIYDYLSSILSRKILSNTNAINYTEKLPNILFCSPDNRLVLKRDKNGNEYYVEPLSENLNNHLKSSEFEMEYLFSDLITPGFLKKCVRMTKKFRHKFTLLATYWDHDVWRYMNGAINHFEKIYHLLLSDSQWLLTASDILEIKPNELKKILARHIYCSIPFMARHLALVNKTIQHSDPSALLILAEQSSQGRGWILGGKKARIPTVGLQHGVNNLGVDMSYFMHHASDLIINNCNKELALPVPDKLLLWSDFDKYQMEKYAFFNTEMLSVVGNPMFDNIQDNGGKNKESVLQEYGIDRDNYVILWATQSHGNSMDENKQYLSEIMDVLDKLESVSLIIKPHPLEGDKFMKVVSREVINKGLNVIIAPVDSDTNELISIADVVIIKNSTVGQSVVLNKKPLIILDYSINPDSGGYVEQGVALPAYEKGELIKWIQYCISNRDENLEDAQTIFVERHFGLLDGQASKRIVDEVGRLVHK